MTYSYKFKIKYDPRNISSVFLYDEIRGCYVEIPNSDPAFGPISLDEYNYLCGVLKANSFKTDTATIMEAKEHLAELIGGSIREKRQLLSGQRRAKSRSKDLQTHPKTSRSPAEPKANEDSEPWTPEEFETDFQK